MSHGEQRSAAAWLAVAGFGDADTIVDLASAGVILDGLHEGCQIIGFDFRYLYVNDALAVMAKTTPTALLGRTMMECFPSIETTEMFSILSECMNMRVGSECDNEFVFPDMTRGHFALRFIPVPRGMCILSLDVTEQRYSEQRLICTEEQLRQSQKIEAVGRLAGGIAHDFNNLLSVILTSAELARDDIGDARATSAELDQIIAAGRRATKLTRQLLAFSRQQPLNLETIDLNKLLRDNEKMLRRVLGDDIAVTYMLEDHIWPIHVDVGQLEQVKLNLAVNARDAMPRGGTLRIQTRNVVIADDGGNDALPPGNYVELSMADTGVGMDAYTRDRAFEPFFTTKPAGKGTGLGLSTVFGIIKQSAGHIVVDSEPNNGTTFRIYLPKAQQGSTVQHLSQPPPTSLRGDETVLVIEDDELVRQAVVSTLVRYGYTVLEAANGGEAWMLVEQHQGPIHLLFTDVVLPRMGGRQIAERLTTIRPDMKVLYMSGYTDDRVLQHGILESSVAFVQKPVTPEVIARKVREVLDAT